MSFDMNKDDNDNINNQYYDYDFKIQNKHMQ